MKRNIKRDMRTSQFLVTMALVSSLLFGGFASPVAAQEDDPQEENPQQPTVEDPGPGDVDSEEPEPEAEFDCSGEVPIVVATDAAAEADTYSAVTLAGVLDTRCIVDAGPRDAAMPTEQRTRLDRAQSGGWIVGGTAAVPPSKTAGRTMRRIGGADRWHTARLVGAVAADPDANIALLHSTVHAWNPLTDPADCSGEVAIVVASDEAAQSDLYSAVTLAGVLDTECIVLAGSRDAAMPAAQRARLDRAQSGGWIVGGTAAVPPSKTAGRDMKRIAGADRWLTALFVGVVASDPDVDVESLATRYAA